jgi:hypothetical protein
VAKKPKEPTHTEPTHNTKPTETKMSGNFESILSKPMSAVERPKPRPVGTYIGMVTAPPKIEKIGKNQTLAAIFEVKLLSPGPDIDASALQEAGGMGTRALRVTQFLTEDALYRTKEFLNALGVDVDSMSVGEALSQAASRQALFKIKHRPSQDGTELYEEFDGAAAL